MKVRIDFIEPDEEPEIVIRCHKLDENVQKAQEYLAGLLSPSLQVSFWKENEEFYLSLDEILFFETGEDSVYAHSEDDAYKVKFRLYELEEKLPRNFVRVSKSTIINMKHVYSIQRNLTSSSKVQFRGSYKEVFVSRMYYKVLTSKLQERNFYEK